MDGVGAARGLCRGYCARLHLAEEMRQLVPYEPDEFRHDGLISKTRVVILRRHLVPDGCFRQGRALDARELRQWARWSSKVRAEVLLERA